MLSEPLRRRGDLSDEVAHQNLVGQRRERHLTRLKPRRAGIDGAAVELDHALLAGIGVDARKADGKARIGMLAHPAHAVEHRLTGLERDLVGVPVAGLTVEATPDLQRRHRTHCAAATVATLGAVKSMWPARQRTTWLTCQSSDVSEKSSRWWAPRLSVRASAASVTTRATSSMLR